MSIRFPLDLSSKTDQDFPFVQFQIVKFRERTLLKDFQGQSSQVDQNQATRIGDDVSFNSLAGMNLQDAQNKIFAASKKADDNLNITVSQNSETVQNIFLPLPKNLTNNYSPSWEMADMMITNSFMDAMAADTVDAGFRTLAEGIAAASLKAGQYAQKFLGMTPNPKKQALFNGIEPRTFSFDYTFSPQSLQEAELVDQIVSSFVTYSLPTLKDPTSAFFGFPCEYKISFHQTKGFPKINWCVCTSVSTNYGPNTLQLFESGHISQINLTLTFLETDLRTQERPGI